MRTSHLLTVRVLVAATRCKYPEVDIPGSVTGGSYTYLPTLVYPQTYLPPPTPCEQTRLWKHYLPSTTVAGDKIFMLHILRQGFRCRTMWTLNREQCSLLLASITSTVVVAPCEQSFKPFDVHFYVNPAPPYFASFGLIFGMNGHEGAWCSKKNFASNDNNIYNWHHYFL